MLKTIARRLLALLLAVSIVLSMMTGMLLIVSAVGENAIRNWGVRDTVCTQLSSAAQSYYTGSNAYSTLKTLSGASSTANSLDAATNNDLFNALHTLMEDTHTTVDSISYSSHSSWYAYTDCENGDTSGKMKLLWAGGYRTWDGSYVNREHVWCKSHATYVETNGGADLHHLRPASAYVNQTPHNNKPYGSAQANGGSTCVDESGNFGGWYLNSTTGFSNGQFEPPDNAKGDCARILLYVYTRWKQPNLYTSLDTSSSTYLNFVEETPSGTCDGVACIESLETLLKWCRDDPVDTWEMGRNDSVQSIQGNRNVFIDYPELAWYMFGQTPPANMTTPSGDAANGGVSYEIIKATVNNNAYGSVSVTNSNTVTVFPAAGCYIVDATSTSGTVSINGNVITVTGMTADATVNVVLAQNASFTISFSVPNGMTQASMSGYGNSTITLPTPTGTPTANAQSYEFVGWTTGAISDTTTLPTCYAAGSNYTITGNATLIALFRYNTSTGTGSAAFDPNGTGGTYVLAANVDGTYYALPVSGLGTARPAGAEITVTNGAVSATDASGYEWTLTKDGTAFNISGGGQYLTWSSSTSLGASSDAYAWTIKANDTTTWKIIPSGASTRSLIFRAGSYNVFGGYAVTNLGNEYKAIEILPIGSGTVTQTHYTTDLQSTCDHTYGSAVSAGASGHTYTCTICRDSYTEPHTYTTSVSGLTTTYTCSVCGYRYQTTLDTYTISYNIRGTVSNTVDVTEGDSVTLPSATAYTGYTFCGWATAPITTDTETVPTVLTGSYTPTASVTLYAVYSHVVQSADSGSSSYVLVTNTNQLVSGRNLIIAAKDYDYAMADVYNSYYRNQGAVTKSGSTLTPGSEVIPFTLGAGSTSGTWSLYDTKNKSYLSAYVSGRYYDLGAQGVINADTSFTISVAGDGTASLTTNRGTCVVKYIKSTSYEEYKCVSASTTSNIYDIALYVETPGTSDATFYTTQPTIQCAHPNTTLTGAVAATCTADGYTGDTWCIDCNAKVAEGTSIPALGHDYVNHAARAVTCTAIGWDAYQTCSRCDYTTYTEISALGHDIIADPAVAATCTVTGLTAGEHCSRCDYAVAQTETPELGHAWDDGVVTTAATIYSTGVMTYHCTRCDATKTEEIPRLTHTHYAYLTAANAATCTAGGNSAYYYCYGCGKYFSDSECANEIETNSWVIPALGHDYVNGVCTRCGDKSLYIRSAALVLNGKIDIAFTAQLPSGYSSPKMTFTGPNGTVTVTEYTQTDGYYVFTYTGINPQCIGDNIAATLIATKNWSTEESVSIDNYSVRQYCVNKLADETISAELRTLLSDILAYGAAAQTYMDYKTNSPVNIGTDIINPTYSTYSDLSGLAPSFTGTADSSYYWLGAGLTLTNSVAMTFRFYAASTSGLRVKVTLNGTTTTFSVSDFTAVDGKENTYEITLTGISAEDLDETVTAAIERYYSPIGNTLSYSVNTYIQSKQADSNENLAALVKALYNYGASAEAYAS